MNNYYGISSYGDYLEHEGRKGQKKGIRNGPPYPLDQDTVHSAYGGAAAIFPSNLLSKAAEKFRSRKNKKEERPEETPEERKERILKTNNIEDAWAHKEDFTTQEINNIINRVNAEKNLKKLVDAKNESAFKKGVDFLKTANDVTTTVLNAYNNYNNLKKIFTGNNSSNNSSKNSKNTKNSDDDSNKKSTKYKIKEGIELYNQVKGLLPDKQIELDTGDNNGNPGGKKKRKKK